MSDAPFDWRAPQHHILRNLVAGQFNADWDEDYESWIAAIDDYGRETPGWLPQALASLEELLRKTPDEQAAERELDRLPFMGFDPRYMGPSQLAWLRELRCVLARRLARDEGTAEP